MKVLEKAVESAVVYRQDTNEEHKKCFGQYFTPHEVSHFMSSLFNIENLGKNISILDPGAGTGTLSISLIEHILSSLNEKLEICLTAYEIDKKVANILNTNLTSLKEKCSEKGINFAFNIIQEDFVTLNHKVLNKNSSFKTAKYDLIISNPPYFKLNKTNPLTKLVSVLKITNIYAAFSAISALLLKPKGQTVFIIPRSFASGVYFEKYREFLFKNLKIEKIHLFKSRKKAFKEEKVLQENLIYMAVPKIHNETYKVRITTSEGIKDLSKNNFRLYSIDYLIDLHSKHYFLFLPTSNQDEYLINYFKKFKNLLADFKLTVSTGPVVNFRSKPNLTSYSEKLVPLIWLNNVMHGYIEFPIKSKFNKQSLILDSKIEKQLRANDNYILVRRFSTKDDERRIIAAPLLKDDYNFDRFGFENKLNYIYSKEIKLSKYMTKGISHLLNTNIYDNYFSIFNGNTQVSATELKNIPFPNKKTIIEIGELNYKSMEDLNLKIETILDSI
ncbi:Eco57I restriction-modification methylase domain-containing protein [Polaribacter vadi]|uniref:Eco57I restriction-modification methylase domain-containing protein n=1 Tax=Polaribacter TaxID=52959 RepID=UPI001C0960DD|nr:MULTISPECIES: N-6 DNA methylase [Polaribacter]MBU3010184.1 Eco57I restriction-modification methylase domain-containing protein [Polaribacter vadi]MDO6739991.1 Eco57I restriction-modification methylase domain-containing protein [Polaribacter sp. 1_MG-2023]